jgi:DNA-binding response OmpR family regulator
MFPGMAQSKTVLIVDDDADLRGALAEQLQLGDEFATFEAPTGEAGVAQAQERRPDIILLDLDLPDIDGREVCRRVRAGGISAPIIMLTAASGDQDTINGLDAARRPRCWWTKRARRSA